MDVLSKYTHASLIMSNFEDTIVNPKISINHLDSVKILDLNEQELRGKKPSLNNNVESDPLEEYQIKHEEKFPWITFIITVLAIAAMLKLYVL